jgi:hypothetical protein
MSFTLGSLTLPFPKSLTRGFIETGAENTNIEGKTTKRKENRKEVFELVFQNLETDDADSILSEHDLEEVRTFTVNETNLSIGPTDVLVNIINREYVRSGGEYRQNLTLVLKEVS